MTIQKRRDAKLIEAHGRGIAQASEIYRLIENRARYQFNTDDEKAVYASATISELRRICREEKQ